MESPRGTVRAPTLTLPDGRSAVKILFAVAGSESMRFFQQAVALTVLDRSEEIILAHVIDTKHRAEVEFGRERFFTKHALPESRGAELTRAEEDRAQAGLRFARQALVDAGVDENRMHDILLHGRPNEELRRLADEEGIDLIVVGGREGKPGPHSIGKTARFLIDHAPRAALLVR